MTHDFEEDAAQAPVISTSGFELGLLGIDGIGKSTLTNAIVRSLREDGYEVLVLSWRRWLQTAPAGSAREVLLPMHGAAVRALFADARTADGRRGIDLLPPEGGLIDNALLVELVAEQPHFNDGRGVLAAMHMEASASVLLRQQVIEPALRAGTVVIQESFSYKQLVKQIEVAAHHLRLPRIEVERLHASVADLLATVCRPSAGLFLVGDPAFAYECRVRDSGGLGPIEHLGDPDLEPLESYLRLQRAAQVRFAAFADRCGWPKLDMHASDLDTGVKRGVALARELVGVPTASTIGRSL